MKESAPAANREIRRHISSPFGFDLIVDVSADGEIEAVGKQTPPGISVCSNRLITRSVLYVGCLVHAAATLGQMATDVKRDLPDTPLFGIEHAILDELIAIQALVNPSADLLASTLRRGGQ